ncbi:OV-16 antigen [Trichinella murrelli]|uniref:OV-16 antigen n=1 Tax=Trichinella murrelli TaxID=144512 RepID=A0A0V0TLY4_9BILA|nr:OV-16 antigen [Trichinella murrelli]
MFSFLCTSAIVAFHLTKLMPSSRRSSCVVALSKSNVIVFEGNLLKSAFIASLLVVHYFKLNMAEDVAGKFKEAGIVPDVLDKAPTEKLEVLFPGKPAVNLGDTFHTLDVRHAPKVSYPGKEGHYYSLIMIDPDNLSRENPCQAEWIQWMVLNIPYDAISAGMMSRHLVGYMIPGPQPRTGLHRFVFLLFEHHMRKLNQPSIKSRAKFKVREFMAKHKLSDPVAGNYFLSQHDG